jgi:hypothetical protein
LSESPGHADRLFAVPLEDFVAERKQVAKELRDAGDRDAAAQVAKFPKPTPPAWALNRLAREEPDTVGEWLDAAEELREVSANPGAGLREAMAEHRDATRRLLTAARDRTRPGGRPLSEPMLDRVRALLQAATADPEQAEALRRGTLVEDGEPPALPAAGEGGEAPRRDSTPAATSRAAERAAKEREAEREAERKAKEHAERLAELERHVKAAEQELERLREESAERDAAAAEADERLEDARRTLHRSESEASAAQAAAADARTATATAERELRQLARQLRNASS